MIRTASKRPNGHWRADVFHHAKGSEFRDDAFTPEQLKQLKADPFLTIEKRQGEPTGQPPARPGETPSGANAAEHERLADLTQREAELNKRLDAFNELASEVAGREAKVAEREQTLAGKQEAIDELLGNEAFRAIALRYGIQRVVVGKAPTDFTKGGLPTTEAISREVLGIECSARERDALFAELYPPK